MPTNVALTGLAKDLAARAETGKPVRIGLVGAGEMGTDIVSRVAHMRGIEIGAISELNSQAAGRSVTIAYGDPDRAVATDTTDALNAAIEQGRIATTQKVETLLESGLIDVVIDATGIPSVGAEIGLAAMERGKHLVMMNVEADVTIGGRPARTASLVARFGRVTLKRPANLARQAGLAETVEVSLVEVCEVDAPPGAEPILWRLLTTHGVEDAAMAWAAWLAGTGSARPYRAILPHPETAGAATGRQPVGKRRAVDQADRDCRPCRLHHHATRPGARWQVRAGRQNRLLASRNRNPPRNPPRTRRQDRAPKEPSSA